MTRAAEPIRDTNVDPREVEQFDRQAGSWWDTEGPFRLLHKIAPVRLGYIRSAAEQRFGLDPKSFKPFDGLKILDVGCGGGLISEPLARLGGEVLGIDPAEKNIATAKAHAEAAGLSVRYRAGRAEDLEENRNHFDIVVCLEVIEHVPDPKAFVGTLAGLVAPGGLLVLSTLNRTARSYALAIVGAEYILRWLPRGTHDWNRFITPRELEDQTKAAGLTDFTATGMVYNPLRDAWSLSPDTAINYLAAAHKPGA